MRKLCLILLILSTLGLLTAKSYFVKEFSSTIVVNADGTLDVEETMLYHFEGGPFKWISRDVRAPHGGFIILNEALVDGKEILRGDKPGQISLKNSDNLKAKLNLDSISDQAVRFTLNYKVYNSMVTKGSKAVLAWTPMPDKYDFIIERGRVTINYPPEIPLFEIVTFLENTQNVEYEELDNSLICTFSDLKDKSFEIKSDIPLNGMSLKTYPSSLKSSDIFIEFPHLKIYATLYKVLMGMVVLFLLIVIYVIIRRYNNQSKNLPVMTSLPSQKHPALVARLLQVGSDDINLIPVLMHMAIKKLISFTQVTNKKGHLLKDYYIDIAVDLSSADDFDLGYLELLRKEEARKNKRIELKVLLANSYRHKKELLELINKKFDETGLVDILSKKKYYQKVILFFVLLIIGVVAIITGAIFFARGYALAPIPAFLIILYWIYMMLHLDDKSILSPSGLIKWKEWKAFKNYIGKSLKNKEEELSPNDAEKLFSYILIMGYGQQYLHYFTKKNIDLNFPNLGEIADDIESLNTLITVVVVSTMASGGTGTGVSGGGGGGGAGAG